MLYIYYVNGICYLCCIGDIYVQNILEMLYFFSDRKNNKVEDIKEIKPNTLDMAEKIFSTINGHAMGKLKSYPTINIAEKNFITGGGNSMKKVRVFLGDDLKTFKE
jgi:hypothetical protein